MLKKIIPVTLVIGSLGISALIFLGKIPGELATAPLDRSVSSSNEPIPANSPVSTDAVSQKDTVQAIASGISDEIINNNPDGPQTLGEQLSITATDPNKIVEKLMQNGMNIDYSKFNPEIKLSDLHILHISDKNLAENYFKSAEAITERNFSGVSSDFSKETAEDLKKTVAAYNQALSELYSLDVPANLAELHVEKIKLFTFEKNLFENISNYQADPLAALISMKMFGKAYDDLNNLSKKIADFAIQNHLNI